MRLDQAPDLVALASDPGLDRAAVVTVQGWRVLVADPAALITSLHELDQFADAVGWRNGVRQRLPQPPLAVGFLTDDLAAALLDLPRDNRPAMTTLPALEFGVYEWCIAVSPSGEAWAVGPRDAIERLQRWAGAPAKRPSGAAQPRRATGSLSRDAHAAAVAQILDWIAAGDIYQANLTLQLATPWEFGAGALAARFESVNPAAAHAALLTNPAADIVSSSPETFLRVDGDIVITRPIKGTRPRHRLPADDLVAADELQSSAKDHAEHVMIVDLERNDLGRVCEPGSVVVPEYARLEGFPTVWHLTSTVRGRLPARTTLSELIAATFPPGSVTGTPKRMAVARLTQLEPVRRGVYCGAIGVVGAGVVDLSVAIRTAVVADGVASYGTGGGIVADSTATAEYEEAMAKARAFRRATNATVS